MGTPRGGIKGEEIKTQEKRGGRDREEKEIKGE
jgi:hypothetical protein